jgi:hypothetical protein
LSVTLSNLVPTNSFCEMAIKSISFPVILSIALWPVVSFWVHEEPPALPIPRPHTSAFYYPADSGKLLAQQYCGGCHLFPDPSLLDKKTWTTGVLPNMALRLGVKPMGSDPYEGLPEAEIKEIRPLGVYPETAALSQSAWEQLVAYYEKEAPEAPLPQPKVPAVINQLPLFKVQALTIGDKPAPKTTLLKYDPASSYLYVGDDQNSLAVLDSKLNLIANWWIDTTPTDIDFPKNAAPRLLTIGVFSPSDQKLGRLLSVEKASQVGSINLQGLSRPVQFAAGDLNADGKEDVVICEFGNHAGKLSWYESFDSQKQHTLSPLPGARKVEIRDLNNDKKPDIVVLMAQAQEGVSVFYNLGNGKFREKSVLKFHPAFGASYFELVDFNQDGYLDILLTNGDNWDYSPINKNYHGVHIYLNDRKDNFREAFFYPLYGASKALARDFDNDGDLDIAVTSFYSDLTQPEQGFIYLSNKGNLNFEAFSTPEAAAGKWLTMEAADVDQDGDIDIVLGSYFQSLGELTQLVAKGILEFPQLLILANDTKKCP